MANLRTVTVKLRGPAGKYETISEDVPADWISGENDAMEEILSNKKLRTRLSVNAEFLVSAQISEPWDPDKRVFFA